MVINYVELFMNSDCMVSIFCTAYNHKQYIADALEGFISQKTDFPFEVLVTDDASTDGTTEIIRSYSEKYPDIIRFFHQEENRFSKGGNLYEEVMYPNARGKYIAYCEGDDYWCSEDKLQRQVDFLEGHTEYSACVHNSYYRFCNSERSDELVIPQAGDRDIPFSVIIKGMSRCFHTSSILGRATIICSPPDFQKVAFEKGGFTDYAIAVWLSINGSIHFIDEPLSVYRVNSNPESWKSGLDDNYSHKIRFVSGEAAMLEALLPHLTGDNSIAAKEELLRRNYELLYLEGKVDEMMSPPYLELYKAEPVSFRFRTTLKKLFPALHKLYRSRQGYR